MKKKLKVIFNNYWPSLITMPVFVMIICYCFYQAAYFATWSNFAWMTLPWFSLAIVVSTGSLWFRSLMLRHFIKLEDWAKRIIFSLLGYVTIAAIPPFLVYWLLNRLPYPELRLSSNQFYTAFIFTIVLCILYTTIYEGITYFSKWKEAISEAEELEKLTLESQFRSLQSQLNPHFLFNSFNVLSSLITENPRRAEDFVDELSNVYRYLLRSNEQELASVAEELRFIRSYFHLLETRHDAGISLEVRVNKGVFDKKLPALALQVLVENAVKHNEVSPEKPLKIEIFENGKTLIVRNNMQRKATKPLSNQIGLENLRQRYELLGKVGFGVEDDGQFFTVSLPMI